MRNGGTIAGLRTTTWWSCPRASAAARLDPLPQEPLAPELLGLDPARRGVRAARGEAAVTGDTAIARKALLAHPLIGQQPLNEELVESLIAAEAERLPRSGKEALA